MLFCAVFVCIAPSTTEIYTYSHTLSLHDALTISMVEGSALGGFARGSSWAYPIANLIHLFGLVLLVGSIGIVDLRLVGAFRALPLASLARALTPLGRSEEHTSELQSLMRISYAVLCLKKKKNKIQLNKQKD